MATIKDLLGSMINKINDTSEEIANYLPKNQGAGNVGKILAVGTDGKLTLIEMPEGGATGDVTGVLDESNNLLLSGNIANGTYQMKWLNDDGTYSDAGTLEVGAIVTYTITQNLTNATSNNSTAEIRKGESFIATLTANSGYNMGNITVTMGGADITATVVSGNTINIGSVIGDVVITATAKEPAQPVTQNINITKDYSIELSAGTLRGSTSAGYCTTDFVDVSNLPKPVTFNLTGAGWAYADASQTGYVRFFIADKNGTKLAGDYTHQSKMPEGVTMVYNDAERNNVTVMVNSDNVGKIRFAGIYGNSTAADGTGNFADAKATYTYTPTE